MRVIVDLMRVSGIFDRNFVFASHFYATWIFNGHRRIAFRHNQSWPLIFSLDRAGPGGRTGLNSPVRSNSFEWTGRSKPIQSIDFWTRSSPVQSRWNFWTEDWRGLDRTGLDWTGKSLWKTTYHRSYSYKNDSESNALHDMKSRWYDWDQDNVEDVKRTMSDGDPSSGVPIGRLIWPPRWLRDLT